MRFLYDASDIATLPCIEESPLCPKSTLVALPPGEHRQILAALRRARSGDLLAPYRLWLGAAGRQPTPIAAVLFCARSSV